MKFREFVERHKVYKQFSWRNTIRKVYEMQADNCSSSVAESSSAVIYTNYASQVCFANHLTALLIASCMVFDTPTQLKTQCQVTMQTDGTHPRSM